MTLTVFSLTKVLLSKEVVETLGQTSYEGELNKICLENDVKSTLTNDNRFILEGDWAAMITIYNSIVKFLNKTFKTKEGELTSRFVEKLSQVSGRKNPSSDEINRVEKQSKHKIPEPIVYSVISDGFSAHHKSENLSQKKLVESNTNEKLQFKHDHDDVEVLVQGENSVVDDVEYGTKKSNETSRSRQRKCQTPKKTIYITQIGKNKGKTIKKSNVQNSHGKTNQKKPSSLKPKKSWSKTILENQNTEISEYQDENFLYRNCSTLEHNTINISNKKIEIVGENENKNKSDDEWIPESDKKTYFQVKGNKSLKLILKKNQRSTRFSCIQKKTATANVRSEYVATQKKIAALDKTVEVFFNCPNCSYVTKKKGNFREHVQRMHNDKVWECKFCSKTFSIQKDLVRHEKSHGTPQLCCDFCGKMYKSQRTFLLHKKSHEEDYVKPEFECEICKKSFSTKYVLNYHVKSEHKGIKKQFLCPTCGKSFTQKNSYIQHANVHMGLKPYQCEHCGKSFAYEKSLKEHRYMHDDILHFKCDICKKFFRQKSALQIHRKIHNETKDHLCGICGKGFTQRQALLRHERIHNGDKPFKCGICSRTFSDASIIRRHMILVHKKHTKEWREDVICDLKGADDYWIDGKKPEGRIKRLPTSKNTTNEPVKAAFSFSVEKESTDNRNDTYTTSFQVPNDVGKIINHYKIQRSSTIENKSSCEGELLTHSLYNEEQLIKETSVYTRNSLPLLQPNADESENDMLNSNTCISQFLSNSHIPTETSTSVNLHHTFNETFTNIHDCKSEERLTNPFETNTQTRSAGNQWTAEPYSFNTISYISHFPDYQH